jgi:hypothetical protein
MSNVYKLEYNGITIDVSSQYRITKQEGLDGIPIRISEDPITNKDGGNIWNQKYAMRTMSFEGYMWGYSPSDFMTKRRALNKAFSINTENMLRVTMWDGSVKRIPAKIVEQPMIVDVSGKVDQTNFRVELKAEDPFFLADNEQEITLVLESEIGFPVPMPVPSPITGSGGNIGTINNLGDVANVARYRIKNTVTNPTVTNMANGQYFTIQTSLVDSEYIDVYIDQGNLYITKNDGSNYMEYLKGQMPEIISGNNDLMFTANEYSATAEVEVTFSSKFLSI